MTSTTLFNDISTKRRLFPASVCLALCFLIVGCNPGAKEASPNASESVSTDATPQEAQPDPQPGDKKELAIDGANFVFRYCPSGTFKMGSPEDEPGRRGTESQRDVTLSKGFWLQETETTQAQWEAIMGSNPSRFTDAESPVETVSWYDCQLFVKKLNDSKVAPYGYKFALPTEAQWEYAARAGSTEARYGEIKDVSWNASYETTQKVGRKAANAWGLFDMLGNAWEWTSGTSSLNTEENLTDPFNVGEPTSCRVFRGGCFHSPDAECRAAQWFCNPPDYKAADVGVRLALVTIDSPDPPFFPEDHDESLLGKAVEIEGLYLDGTEIDWSSYRGKYVLLDFWTTWCGFCIREIPFNAKLYERYHDAGFEIIAFSCDSDLDALRDFAENHPEPWKIASSKLSADAEKNYANIPRELNVNGYPTMILFDPEGKIVDLNARGAHLQELLEKAFPDVPKLQDEEEEVAEKKGGLLGSSPKVEGLFLDGTEIDWESYRGKYVLVDLWTTWCGFCIAEIPFNAKLYERYHDAGFEIIAYSCDDDLDALRSFAEKHDEPWKIASLKMSMESDKNYANMYSRLQGRGYPTMILFDPEGKVVDLNARGKHLQELLEKAFPDVEPILTPPSKDEIVSEKTIDGVKYGLAKKAAVVLGAEASTRKLNIPKKIEDLPVLAIGAEAFEELKFTEVNLPDSLLAIGGEAFHGCDLPERLEIPDSVTEIGWAAFGYAEDLETIKLPAKLESLGRYPFVDAKSLVKIEISDDNANYKSVDGVLFTKDGKELVAYPDGKKDATSYTVPEGVEELDGGAFIGNETLTEIILPSSLKYIDFNAFPSGRQFASVTIPKNVSQIDATLTGSGRRSFKVDVDPESEYFKVVDGVVFDKEGKRLVYYPYSEQPTYRVPDGVENITRSTISDLRGIYIPASVKSIDSSLFTYGKPATVFAPKGSYAEEFAKEHKCRFVAMENSDEFPPENFGEDEGGPFRTQIGKKMKLEGVCLDGSELDWDSYRGKYVLVDFWTTWCGFCIAEIPFNKRLYEHYRDAGFEIIAYSCDDDLDALKSFAEKNPEPWTTVSYQMTADAEKEYLDVPGYYEVGGYPTMVLVDPEGKIIDAGARGAHLQELLEKAFPDVPKLPDEEEASEGEEVVDEEEIVFDENEEEESLLGKAIEVEGLFLDGSEIDWESYRGKYVLVDFWTTWCGFCIREIPFNAKLYEHYRDAGFEVIAYSCDDDLDDLRKFAEEHEEPWKIASLQMSLDAEKGYANMEETLRVDGYPTMILFDPEGKIVDLNARGDHLKELLEEAFPDVPKLPNEDEESDAE